MNINWLKVTLAAENVDPEEAAGALAGALGHAVELAEDGPGKQVIHAWIKQGNEGRESAFGLPYLLGEMFPEGRFEILAVKDVEERDWLEEWKKSVKSFPLGERMMVVPTWRPARPGHGRIEIFLDPGMAFGSGHHPTTQLCAKALEGYAGRSTLDIGCGSGLLGIIAAKLGADRVLGIDTDPEACKVARENVELNGVGKSVTILDCGPERVEGEFGMVVSNIFLNAHLKLAGEYARLMAPEGALALSGLKAEQAPAAEERMAGAGLVLVHRTKQEDWTALVFEKRGKGGWPGNKMGPNPKA